MNFKEFLRKELSNTPIEYHNTECESVYDSAKGDFAQAFGEWALQEVKKAQESPAMQNFMFVEAKVIFESNFLFHIAIDCLGKERVEKELSLLSEGGGKE